MREITRLPDAVVSRLRSGTIFSDIAQIAEELVCNSIDAGPTQIQVDVDVEACYLRVDDDGCGISRNDLTLVGERHATTKLHDLEELEVGVKTLGFRGEALSSLSDIALVEITSRCRGMANTYRKILKDCATVSIGICSQQRSHGTAVVVRDVFYNQPVRRRLMITSHRRVLLSLKESIVRFILMHPSISFKVKDLARSEVSVHSKSATSMSTTLCGMFGKDLLLSLEKVDFCHGSLRIAGYVSRRYHCLSSKTVQFFYINRRFVRKTPIHKLFNKWVQSSKNGPSRMAVISTQRLNCVGRELGKQKGNTERRLLPAFVLNLTCPLSEYDITFEASKTMVEFKDWSPVVDLMRSVLQSMWGNTSDVPEEGLIHTSGKSPELSRSKNVRQPASSVRNTGSKRIPPMSVRRALVQVDGVDLCSPVEDSVGRGVGGSTAPCSRRLRSRTKDPVSCSHDSGGPGKMGYSLGSLNAPETIETNPTDSSSHGNDQIIPGRRWNIATCGETLPKAVLSVEKTHLSVSYCQAPIPPSVSDSFMNLKLELSPDSASVTSGLVVGRSRSSSEIEPTATSSSLGESYTISTFAGMIEDSVDLNYNYMRPKDKRVWRCASLGNMDLENIGALSDVSGLNMGAMFCSGRDDSYNIMSSPDSSYFLPEVGSRSSTMSHEQESFTCTFDGSNESGREMKDKLRRKGKHSTVNEIYDPDNITIDHFVSDEERCYHENCFKDVPLLGHNDRKSWKVTTEASEAHKVSKHRELEQQLSEPSVRKFVNYTEEDRPVYRSHKDESGRSSNSSRPRVKRKLEILFSVNKNDMGNGYRNDTEASRYDSERSCGTLQSKRQRRSHSGPPFYQPPKRCGSHENPPNSLSTTKKQSVIIVGDTDHGVYRRGATAAAKVTSRGQAFQRTQCPVDKSSHSSFRPSCPRNGLDPGADVDSAERPSNEEDCSGHHILVDGVYITDLSQVGGQLDTSRVTPVQPELPDVTGRGQNGAAPPNDAVEVMLKDWSNPCMKSDEGVLDLSSGILCWNSMSFLPDSIVKESLQHARVLQQVDKKFIPAVADGVLLMIDQHAADERVRLEELRDRVLGSGQTKQAAPLSCTQELTVPFAEQQMLQTYLDQIEDWGWRFRLSYGQSSKTPTRGGSSDVDMCKVLLSAVPCILGVMLTGEDLIEYLRQLMDTRGSSAPPPAAIRVLNYKACRGAIMFGDILLPAESRQLFEHLKRTSLCFQCAHGRPTMVPLVDLRALNQRLQSDGATFGNSQLPSGSTKRKSDLLVNEWHQLQNRKSSVERSRRRLKQAKQ